MTAPKTRREEVGAWLRELLSGPIRQAAENDILRSKVCDLADEVDAKDAVIDKLLAMLEPGSGSFGRDVDSKTVALTMGEWRLLEQAYARACEIAGRVK